ncbi:MAG: 5-bromo-4-chloroindolyl phosphate hydrolysis family protein [Angelakisella sp.]|nr:5-bromo-4-chloroindolyl phosphate hydrolysis family protein [Angelakisella sp.]
MSQDFNQLNSEINRVVEKVLNTAQLDELKDTIYSAANDITQAAKEVAQEVKTAAQEAQKTASSYRPPVSKNGIPNYQPNYKKNTTPKPPLTYAPGQGWNTQNQPYQATGYKQPKGADVKRQQSGVPAARGIRIQKTSRPFLVFGWIIFIFGVLGLLASVTTPQDAFSLLFYGFTLVTGGGLLGRGFQLKRMEQRYLRYLQLLQGKSYCPISELAAACGADSKTVLKDVKKMMLTQLLPVAYLNDEETCLMLDHPTYQQYRRAQQLQQQKQREKQAIDSKCQASPDYAVLADTLKEGQRYLHQIRSINIDLPEEEISKKLDALEETTDKIFKYVEQHPDRLSQIRKFMSYHLPTTLKLMEAYRDLERHNLNTPEVLETKSEIKGALDNINTAFGTLLSNLMQNDLMELSASVSALETMLAQDGLTGSKDFHSNPSMKLE